MKTFSEYRKAAERTRNNDLSPRDAKLNAALGLGGEAGECVDRVKKEVKAQC